MRVAVFGATGVVGRHVLARLVERGDVVIAIRHERDAPWLDALGVESRCADILDAAAVAPAIEGCEAVMHLATAIPAATAAADWTRNDRVRRDGATHLIAACHTIGIERFVLQSIAMLCTSPGAEWVDEDTPVAPNRVTRSAADMEGLVMDSGLDYRILRGGLFYGGGAGTEVRWREAARRGELVLPGDGSGYVSLVHVSDMARALASAVHVDVSDRLLNVVDDCPVTYRVLFEFIAASECAPLPRTTSAQTLPSFRVRNARAGRALGWRPHYASWRAGLA